MSDDDWEKQEIGTKDVGALEIVVPKLRIEVEGKPPEELLSELREAVRVPPELLKASDERSHTLSPDCWCRPEVLNFEGNPPCSVCGLAPGDVGSKDPVCGTCHFIQGIADSNTTGDRGNGYDAAIAAWAKMQAMTKRWARRLQTLNLLRNLADRVRDPEKYAKDPVGRTADIRAAAELLHQEGEPSFRKPRCSCGVVGCSGVHTGPEGTAVF